MQTSKSGKVFKMIQSNELRLVTENGNLLARDVVVNAATQLQQLERDVMEVASEVSGRIELSLQINKVLRLANDVMNTIQREQQRLQQMRFIPGNIAEAEQALEVHHQFRIDCEVSGVRGALARHHVVVSQNVERMLTNFYDKYEYTSLPILDPTRRQMTADVLEQVKSKWSHLVGLTEIRTKLLNTSLNFYRSLEARRKIRKLIFRRRTFLSRSSRWPSRWSRICSSSTQATSVDSTTIGPSMCVSTPFSRACRSTRAGRSAFWKRRSTRRRRPTRC